MEIKFQCNSCGSLYPCCWSTTKVIGSLISTECSKCKKKITKNMSKFLEEQTNCKYLGRIAQASLMIRIAQQVGKEINGDVKGKKRRKNNDLPNI